MATKNPTLKRKNGSDWDTIYPITLGQNVYGSGTQATTPLLDSNNNINSAFLGNVLSELYTINSNYNASTNKLATASDLPQVKRFI